MTDQTETQAGADDGETVDELTLLKKQADKLGVKYKDNIGVDTLRRRVSAKINGTPDEDEKGETAGNEDDDKPSVESSEMSPAQRRISKRREALRLVRLRITNLNPAKKELHGEIFTVANEIIGDVKKFVPYGEVTEDGYHVPHIIYQQLKTRKFQQVKTKKDPRKPGHMIVTQRWVPEFALEVLPQLSQEELNKLSNAQKAAGALDA